MSTEEERKKKAEYMRMYREKNKEKFKEHNKKYFSNYYQENKEDIKNNSKKYYYDNYDIVVARQKEYATKNVDKGKERFLKWYKKNRDKILIKNKEKYDENKEEINKKQYKYRKKRLKTDIQYYIKDRLSSRIRMAIMQQTGKKTERTIELLGANIDTVRKHIEGQWEIGMTWENHSIIGWHIDHIIPCANFDLTDPEQQKKCFNYTNLQPLWYLDNIQKGVTIPT